MTARWMQDVPTEPQDGRQERLGRGATLPSALASFAECLRESWQSALTTFGGLVLAVTALAIIRALYPLGVLLLTLSQGGHL